MTYVSAVCLTGCGVIQPTVKWPLYSPPTMLESLEGACQKFQYGGNSDDSLRLFVLWNLSFLRIIWIFTV